MKKVQWNVPRYGKAKLGRDCKDHPLVRGTSYNEVSEILGTNGCSNGYPYWDWSVMGVIKTKRGKLVVFPNDFVISCNGDYSVIAEENM